MLCSAGVGTGAAASCGASYGAPVSNPGAKRAYNLQPITSKRTPLRPVAHLSLSQSPSVATMRKESAGPSASSAASASALTPWAFRSASPMDLQPVVGATAEQLDVIPSKPEAVPLQRRHGGPPGWWRRCSTLQRGHAPLSWRRLSTNHLMGRNAGKAGKP